MNYALNTRITNNTPMLYEPRFSSNIYQVIADMYRLRALSADERGVIPEGVDIKWCFVTRDITVEKFEQMYSFARPHTVYELRA